MPEISASTKRAGWTTVAFGDVVQLSKERSRDPEAEGYERYIGLEHIDPGELRVRRWGNVADGVTFTNVFRPGQVLFGKRRAYQRKVAVADFSGVCSGDIYVLEATGKALLPELLPFICQTDAFFEHAVGTSAGSLSPRTNWKSLASFEFALPPMDEQLRLTTALTATDAAIYAQEDLSASLSRLLGSLADSFLEACTDRGFVGDVVTSTAYGSSKRSAGGDVGVPILGIPNVRRGRLDLESFNRVMLTDSEVERYSLSEGDVLLVRTNGNPHYVGRCVVVEGLPQPFVYASYLIRLRVDSSKIMPAFLSTILNAPSVRRELRGTVRSSAGNYNINTTEIKKQAIPLPTLEEQDAFLSRIAAIRAAQNGCDQRLVSLRALKAGLLRGENL